MISMILLLLIFFTFQLCWLLIIDQSLIIMYMILARLIFFSLSIMHLLWHHNIAVAQIDDPVTINFCHWRSWIHHHNVIVTCIYNCCESDKNNILCLKTGIDKELYKVTSGHHTSSGCTICYNSVNSWDVKSTVIDGTSTCSTSSYGLTGPCQSTPYKSCKCIHWMLTWWQLQTKNKLHKALECKPSAL